MSEPRQTRAQHPAHQGREELKHWRPDQRWYHPTICSLVVNASRFVMSSMNELSFEGRERWDALFGERGEAWERQDGRGLLSFSNHVSLFDDPLLISNLGATRYRDVRWIAADHINFFGSRLKGILFSAGKCVPLIRGGGLKQPGFDFLRERLLAGEWVHIFPEGGRSRRAEGRLQLPFKIGVGRLICEASPVVMPFFHYGMHRVQPIGATLPRRGQEVKVRFGESTVIDEPWREATLSGELDEQAQWRLATDWAEGQLLELERQVHPELSEGSARNAAAEINAQESDGARHG